MKMADDDVVEGAGYWLPSEFLTDDDFVTNKENSDSKRFFPTDFPCNFQIQSNNDAVGDLALAAGEVAKLNLNPSPPPNTSIAKTGSLFPPQFGNIGPKAGRGGGGGGTGHVAWAPNRGVVAHGGGATAAAGAKKACAGTGVFLPRRYDIIAVSSHPAAAPRRSPAYPFQGREATQIHTKPLPSHFVENETKPLPPAKISGGVTSDHYSALARRRDLALRLRQQRSQTPVAEGSQMIGCDLGRLPVEWTY